MLRACTIIISFISLICVQIKVASLEQGINSNMEESQLEISNLSRSSNGDPELLEFLSAEEPIEEAKGNRTNLKTRKMFHTFEAKAMDDSYQMTEAKLHPYSVMLNVTLEGKAKEITYKVCSGTLLSCLWILTAAHCIKSPDHVARSVFIQAGKFDARVKATGDNSSAPTGTPEGAQAATSTEWHLHPNYDPAKRTYDYDLALVKLPRMIPTNEYVQPVRLWTAPVQLGFLICSVTAFGEVDGADGWVRVTHNLEAGRPCACDALLRAKKGEDVTSRYICAKMGQKFVLREADSGSGLICENRLTAVSSWQADVADVMKKGFCGQNAPPDPSKYEIPEAPSSENDAVSIFQDIKSSIRWIETTANLTREGGGAPREEISGILLLAAFLLAHRGLV